MTFDEARKLILFEANDMDGLVVLLRGGDDPGAERMARLVRAVRVVFDTLKGSTTLDRKLASALHAFTEYVMAPVLDGPQSKAWRAEFHDEVIRLGAAVDSVFEDIWEEWVREP